MKRKVFLAIMAILMLFALSSCVCEHEWKEADCVTPKSCSLCEETEGEPLDHNWLSADCVLPEHCSRCEETVGEALGHTWAEATCTTPKTCIVCTATEGEALGHTWAEATCTTPKTCIVCAATEGEALDHTWAEATCTTPKTCIVCAATEGEALGHTWAEATCTTPKTCIVCTATEGEALGHTWAETTCTTPKTCIVCAATEGEALGHTWAEATCTTPKTCTVCAATEGEALGHTWAEATCTTPKTCIVCAATEDDALPHTYGKWAIRGEQMVHTCTDCQTEEATAIDYDAYLEDALSGEWLITHVLDEGETYPIRAGLEQKYVGIYLNFQEGKKVQYYCDYPEPTYWDCTWEVDETSLSDENLDYVIHMTSGFGSLTFKYGDNGTSQMSVMPQDKPFSNCIMTRLFDERVAQSLSQNQWYAITNQLMKLDFAQDYTFTGYLDGEEIAGNWFVRDVYVEGYSGWECDIVIAYQKAGRPHVWPLCIYYGSTGEDVEDALKSVGSIYTFDYASDVLFYMSKTDMSIASIQEAIPQAYQMVVGTWNAVKVSDRSSGSPITTNNTDHTITLLEDGTFVINDAYAALMESNTKGTWKITSAMVGYRSGIDLGMDLVFDDSSHIVYADLVGDELTIFDSDVSVTFVIMTQEELDAIKAASDEADRQLIGTWTSLNVTDYSGEVANRQSVFEYVITLAEDRTFTLNDSFAKMLAVGTTGTWNIVAVSPNTYGEIEIRLNLTFECGTTFDALLLYDTLNFFNVLITYEFAQLTQ